jgi:hypothetical protein
MTHEPKRTFPIRIAFGVTVALTAIVIGVAGLARPIRASVIVAAEEHPMPFTTADTPAQPDPIDDIATPVAECVDDFARGHWTETGKGDASTVTGLTVDTDGVCETVVIALDGASPDVAVTSVSHLNWTTLRFDTDDVPAMPTPELVTTSGDVILGVVPFVDNTGPGVFVFHPIGVRVAVHVSIIDDTLTVNFRESAPGDLVTDDGWGGEPYTLGLDGVPHAGLIVLRATELEGSGEVGILGYARSPEAHVTVRIWDGDALVDEASVLTEGPAFAYGRYHHNTLLPNGTYTVEIGWNSPSGVTEYDVWHTTQIDVIGNL